MVRLCLKFVGSTRSERVDLFYDDTMSVSPQGELMDSYKPAERSQNAVVDAPTQRWYHLVSYFFGGIFLMNVVPHLVNGVSGRPFQSPFASPPGEGLSSSMVNVVWGMFNLVIAYLLIVRVGSFQLRRIRHAVALGLGAGLIALQLARTFGRFHGGAL